jgi:hypothetical protein
MPAHVSERTPLLRSSGNGSAVTEDEITAAEVVQQGEGGAPQFPEPGKSKSHSHGQLAGPGDGSASKPATENLVNFQENGKLEGVGVWKFRFVFGGILLGYFVRLSDIIRATLRIIVAYSTTWMASQSLLALKISDRAVKSFRLYSLEESSTDCI